MDQTLTYKIRGLPPGLMTHNPIGMALQQQQASSVRTKSKVWNPVEEAELGCYRTPEGYCAIKGEGIRASIIDAALDEKIGRKALRSFVSHIRIEPDDLVVLYDLDWKPITDYKIDTRRAIVQGQGILRSRPSFEEWQASLKIIFDDRVIEVSDARAVIFDFLVAKAGVKVGVGEFRPRPPKTKTAGRGGSYGRFEIVA